MRSEAQFAQKVCHRLPLAEAVMRCLDAVLNAERLDAIFERYRGRCYEDVIRFPTLVGLISEALLERGGSAHQSFERARDDGELEAGIRAHYRKMSRLPISLGAGLLREGTAVFIDAFAADVSREIAEPLRDFEIHFVDGKKVKNVSKRLGVLRNLRGHIIGGKVLAAMEGRTGLVRAMAADPDGEAGDNGLLEPLLEDFDDTDSPRLWVIDRAFSDLNAMQRLRKRGEDFLIRHNRKLKFRPDPQVPAQEGVTQDGLSYVERWGWVGGENDPRRRRVRQIHLSRPTGEDVLLLTSLLDAEASPAWALLQTYRRRWGIEEVFQQVVEVFHLKQLISSTPQGTLFQASFCFLIYNVVQIIRSYLASGQGRTLEEISTEKIFIDVKRQLVSWHEMLDVEATVRLLNRRPTTDLAQELRRLLHPLWNDRWLKATKPKPSPKDKGPTHYVKGGHTSVFRVLRGLHATAR